MTTARVDRKIAIGTSVVFALALSACGGGGGVNSTPVPVPPTANLPPTPPPPPPPPPSTNFTTTEYLRSDGPSFHRAITAYQAGANGRGVTVGVIDSGITPNSHEFTGRIHAQSGDVTGAGRPLGDEDGHGTEVTRVLAAAKDDRDVHGIAYNATILALRADQAGTCTTPTSGDDSASCSFFNSAIAAGVNRAVDNGARVINISLGGAGGASTTLRAAINRATLAGVVIVVSAGNEGDELDPAFDPNSPSPFAQALLANGNGLVIISTSVDDNDVISNFSNKAGVSQNAVLSALGQGICCEYQNDTIYLDFVHDVDMDLLRPDADLRRQVISLPGRKLIFTNADAPYAERILAARGLDNLFEDIFDIHRMQHVPKPAAASYDSLCAQLDINPARALFVEDSAHNLLPAKVLGMTTIWVNHGTEAVSRRHSSSRARCAHAGRRAGA